jgi:hypothetical protein
MESVVMRSGDLPALATPEGIAWLESLWLCEEQFQEAFQALCSILTRGKNLCSPTKRQKRKANGVYFAALAGLQLDSTKAKTHLVNGRTRIGLLELAAGMAKQSARWLAMTPDEILSVVILIDQGGHGSMSWGEFYDFCHQLEEKMSSTVGTNSPQKAIGQFYADLVVQKQALLTGQFMEKARVSLSEERLSALTTQLIKLAICARLNGLNPLTLLMNLKIHEKAAYLKRKKHVAKNAKLEATTSPISSPKKVRGVVSASPSD